MTWDQVKEVMDKGITIGSHTKTHAFLTKTEDKEVLMDELAGSKKIIEESIGRSVDFLAYPFYMQNEHVQDFVKRAGYRSALAGWKKETPSTETLFALKRNEVTNDMKMFPSFLK
jgi:peptidoglycan/xylan/chitin deacetylase (PgdA/CDA1 family)